MNLFKRFIQAILNLFNKPASNNALSTPGLPAQEPIKVLGPVFKLSWELACNDNQVNQIAKPERAAWSNYLYLQIENNYETFMQAKDIGLIIPNFATLSKEQIITAFCELFSQIAKYESSWNPRVQSKDVNGSMAPEQMATGLFQLNEKDQKVCQTGTSFTWKELQDPFNNIKAGVGIVVTMIKIRGKITKNKSDPRFKLGEFFETLIFGAKYNSVEKVLKGVRQLPFIQVPPSLPIQENSIEGATESIPPWISQALTMLGWNEFDHDKQLSVYWKWTNVPGYKTVIGATYAWCALFIGACLELCGIKGTRDAAAKSYADYGKQCDFWFGSILPIRHVSGGHHVTFFLYWIDEENKIAACLGGNQSNQVNITAYNLSGNAKNYDQIIGAKPRWPIGTVDGQKLSKAKAIALDARFKVTNYGSGTR